ncbi:Protein CBG03637 [Caenorhabditis briggsae]|uniref:Protein CBG03637 n=1 Tax=Caenorhabditis briggsae TaxID=6238 RepID=A8WVH7_CAEBR|nr:Protein CBG03637 [Caenorhabditis briggsae]CAP24488.1 Protein CBG03637 [Caenorhabditis briggsae]
MTESRFPFPRLPNDLCSKVLKTMDPHEIIAYTFTSKKALSLVKSLRLPLRRATTKIGWPSVRLVFRDITVVFKYKMGKNDEVMTTLDDIPVNVDVELMRFNPIPESKAFIWSNQGKNIGEWVQHLSSMFRCECYEAIFHIFNTRLYIQSLRNTLPKLRRIAINCLINEPNNQEIQSIENILRAFLPDVKCVRLHRVPLLPFRNLSIHHIGMTNLRELILEPDQNLKFDDLSTLNVGSCTIFITQFSVQSLSHSFQRRHYQWFNLFVCLLNSSISFTFSMLKNDKELKKLDDTPVNAYVEITKFQPIDESQRFTWSNHQTTLGKCIRILCSIFRYEAYKADFHMRMTQYEIQSIRNTFPKLRTICIVGALDEQEEHEVVYAQKLLRVFLPDVENVRLRRVPLQENLSLQHIGMSNLKSLNLFYSRNLKIDDLVTFNVEKYVNRTDKISPLDLNRFFKLRTKGCNPKLNTDQSLISFPYFHSRPDIID